MAQIADSLIIDIRATFEKLASDVNGAARTLSGFEKRFSVIGKGLGAAMSAGAVLGFAAFVKTATTGFVEIGDRAGDVAEAFQRLGGSSAAIQQAQIATMGLVSATDLMQAANKGLLKDIPELNKNFGMIADLAVRVAEATGKDAKGAIDELIGAISTGKVKSLKEFGIISQKGEDTAKILSRLPDALNKFPPAADDVSRATSRLGVSWTNLTEILGQAQNSSESTKSIINLLATEVDNVARGFDYTFGVTQTAKIVKLDETIASLKEQLTTVNEKKGFYEFLGIFKKEVQDLTTELNNAVEARKKLTEEGDAAKAKAKADADARQAQIIADKKAAEAAEARKKWLEEQKAATEAFQKTYSDLSDTILKDKITDSLKTGDKGAFDSLAAQYRKSINAATDKYFTDLKSKGVSVSSEQAETYRQQMIEKGLNPFFEKWDDAQSKATEKAAEELQQGFEDSVNFFSDIFTSVMEGSVMSLGDMLKQVAIGFAAQMAASMTGFSVSGGPGGIGMQIASSLGFGNTASGISSIGASMFPETAGAISGMIGSAGGGAGVMLADGSVVAAGSAAAQGGVASATMGASGMMAAAPYVAAAVGAYLVAKHFGAFGTGATNKETLARKDVVNWLEDKLKKDIKLGPSNRFNTSAGFADLDALPAHAKTAFQGVGGALNALLGITEDTGGQIGAILASNYGSFDDLKHMIQGLGVSLQEFTDKIIATGIEANDTWDTIQNKIDAVTEAMTPGLTAIGAYTEAIQNMTASGGRGMEAIQGLQDAVIEAKQAGFKTLDEWKAKMLSEGKLNSDQINKIFQAFADMGITSMEQLATASVQQLGQIIARLFELGYAFEDTAKKADESTTSISGAIPGSGTSPTTNSNANSAKGNVFSGGKMLKFARGGIFNSPTMFNVGLMGEAGPEAIMPLVRKNGRLGVRAHGSGGAGGLSINIDARGAAPGVEYEVARAIEAMKGELIGMSVAATQEAYRRRGTLSQG